MRQATAAGLIMGSAILVFGGALAANRYNTHLQMVQSTQAMMDIVSESNRDVGEMKAIVESHADGPDKVHAMATAIPAMSGKLRGIDTSKSPADFQQAYLRYRQAWNGVGEQVSQIPQSSVEALSQAFTGMLFGDSAAKKSDPMSAQSDELRSATNDLEATALHDGVPVTITR